MDSSPSNETQKPHWYSEDVCNGFYSSPLTAINESDTSSLNDTLKDFKWIGESFKLEVTHASGNNNYNPSLELQLFKTANRGWGVRTLKDIPKNRLICEYVGEIISNEEADARGKEYEKDLILYLFDVHQDGDQVIDATKYGNISRFINHSCSPNTRGETLDYKVVIVSNRFINQGEEITLDYQFELELPTDDKEIEGSIKCKCNNSKCRGYLFIPYVEDSNTSKSNKSNK